VLVHYTTTVGCAAQELRLTRTISGLRERATLLAAQKRDLEAHLRCSAFECNGNTFSYSLRDILMCRALALALAPKPPLAPPHREVEESSIRAELGHEAETIELLARIDSLREDIAAMEIRHDDVTSGGDDPDPTLPVAQQLSEALEQLHNARYDFLYFQSFLYSEFRVFLFSLFCSRNAVNSATIVAIIWAVFGRLADEHPCPHTVNV
jgi:hypothetical protein